MKITKISGFVAYAALGLSLVSLSGIDAYAWTGGAEDPNTVYDQVTETEEATVSANGEFKQFDPTDPEGPDPEEPTDWIDVMVPTSTDFAQTDATPNGIVAPLYKVTNNSAKGVKISVKDFQDTNTAESAKVPELGLKIENKAAGISIPVVEQGKPIAAVTELATITKKGDAMTFTYSGNVGAGFQFSDVAVKPIYSLVLQLETIN
ncbi:hypothetical protein [Enterococcus malodoratus]|uniref:WxL domain-containing protein n=1 Tax=Enterococcus malodoratus ATCC 43197 TaxID=1158601 RepID=R2QZ91_9ENTE|nr:hypothetical protein [Enterococcus malodoratus]EOH76745.1 hypothetical protein UAI_02420 [Enterococcus malodoratus ATCC 43197]EOT63554.1 hypothetical protein I585_04384 [Enterococcus malodoratus ATCC 43197]SPW69298.1 cell wall associated biofilm protein [Enterococcus malodoratus]STD65875.1 cell wall associated biofilm protein [Enterococcus malodoratus]